MIRQRMSCFLLPILALFLCLSATLAFALDVKRMTKEELRGKLGQEDVVVVDVRTGRDWKSSEFKIKGAVRYDEEIVQWASQYDKESTFVLYCA